jgi:hypothetical protein
MLSFSMASLTFMELLCILVAYKFTTHYRKRRDHHEPRLCRVIGLGEGSHDHFEG